MTVELLYHISHSHYHASKLIGYISLQINLSVTGVCSKTPTATLYTHFFPSFIISNNYCVWIQREVQRINLRLVHIPCRSKNRIRGTRYLDLESRSRDVLPGSRFVIGRQNDISFIRPSNSCKEDYYSKKEHLNANVCYENMTNEPCYETS